MGHRVVILDPFEEVNRRFASLVGQKEITTRFNPLSGIDPKSLDFAEDVMMLADAVIIPTGGDPHWSDSAKALVAGLVAAIVEHAPPGQASFRQVRKLLTASDDELSRTIASLYAKNPESFAGRNLRRFLPKPNKKGVMTNSPEVGSIRSTADTQTFPFESLRLLDSMETDADAFDLHELGTRPVDVFLVLPVDRLQTYGRWLRLVITLAIRAITRAPRPPSPPVLFILDELGTINPGGGLRMIEQAYGLMAGQGIRIWAFLQDLKQLQHDYPNSWETFISNSELIQILKVNDNTTADYFSRWMGEQKSEDFYLKSGAGTIEKSWGYSQVMSPSQIKDLPAGESLCLFSGGKSFRTRKVNYYQDERYRGLYRPNPQFFTDAPKPAPAPPKPAPASPAASVPPINVERVAELGKAAAGKVSGWFAARRDAAAAREQAESRTRSEAAALAERARYAQMIRDAK